MTGAPHDVTIEDGGAALRLAWGDGGSARIAASMLWSECPSAQGRRRRLDGRHINAPAGLKIVRAAPIGHYAINIAFSDGHARGVYPWSLLTALARRPALEDFIAPAAAADAA